MRFGFLEDPRMHFAWVGIMIGVFSINPDLARVAGGIEKRAMEQIDRFGHCARVVLGDLSCPGHLVGDQDGLSDFRIVPCFASQLAEALPLP